MSTKITVTKEFFLNRINDLIWYRDNPENAKKIHEYQLSAIINSTIELNRMIYHDLCNKK